MASLRSLLKPSFRNYTLTLVIFYLLLVFVFHSNLDPSVDQHGRRGRDSDRARDVTKKPILLNRLKENQYDIIEERANRREVKVDPDSLSARYLRDYKAQYVNFELGIDKEVKNQTHKNLKSDRTCTGEPMDKERHEFIQVSPNMYAYSVFWDIRPNDFDNQDGGVYLRIMTIIMTQVAKSKAPLYCLFKNATGGLIPVSANYYEMCENHGKQHGGYILSCKVPEEVYDVDTKVPLCSIRLSAKPEYNFPGSADFKIINTAPVEDRRDFSICVAPLYGNIAHSLLIEFMELSSLLGANHVTFYDFDISPETLSLLNYFESVDRVTIVPWDLPRQLDKTVWYHGQLISILDCLYRNMPLTRYLSFNDIDEYMVPYNFTDWHDMIKHLDTEDHCAYQFNSIFIDPAWQEPFAGPEEQKPLLTVTNMIRSITTSKVRTKCMVKPQLIFEAGIHHISKPILAHLQTIRMDLPLGIIHHHRQCQHNFGMNCKERIPDNIIPSRYAESLYTQYSKTKEHFGALVKNGS